MLGTFLQLVLMILPWPVRRRALAVLLGWKLDPSSRIGFSIIKAGTVTLGPRAMIGSLTYAKGLSRLAMGEGAFIGNLNWITAVPLGTPLHYSHLPDRDPHFTLEKEARITHRHFVDCTGGVVIGEFSNVGGWHCQIMSHTLDIGRSRLDAGEIVIGKYAFVGSRSILMKGCRLPDYCVVAAASVYSERDTKPYGLYRGNPAVREKELSPRFKYFLRTEGFIV